MTPVITRILLRYVAMILVTRGLMGADDASILAADPDLAMFIEAGIGAAIAFGAEAWHWLAQRYDWNH